MRNYILTAFLLSLCFFYSCSPIIVKGKNDEIAIRKLLADQQNAWNDGDIEDFMLGYWKSDRLKFYGANGLTLGWVPTLENYKKRYPDREAMGQLSFEIISIDPVTEGTGSFLLGHYRLNRSMDTLTGTFMLIFKLINEEWKIVADMTCAVL